jgi:ribose 5-phosphate isomerase B
MNIYLATDHAGFEMKEAVKDALTKTLKDHTIIDLGASEYKEDDDYPALMANAARSVSEDALHLPSIAILFGGSGQGEAMVANRFRHVRAATYNGAQFELVKLSREHNDANVLSIGARFVTVDQALGAIKLFIETPFSHLERHSRRVIAIDEVTK